MTASISFVVLDKYIPLTFWDMCFGRQVFGPRKDCTIVFVNLHPFFDSSDNTKHTLKGCTPD